MCPVLETFVFEFSGWPSRLKTWPGRVRLSMEILAKSDTKLPDQTINIDKLRNWVAVVDEEHDLNPNTWSSGQGELVQTYVSRRHTTHAVHWLSFRGAKLSTTVRGCEKFSTPCGHWKGSLGRYPHRTNRTCLPAPPVLSHFNIGQVKTLAICSASVLQVFALCLAHRHSWILLVWCCRLAYCDGSTPKGKSLCPYTAHIAHSVGFVVTEDMHLSRVMSPSEIQWLAEI